MKKLVGGLGWLGLILVVIALVLRYVRPEWQNWSFWMAIAGLVVTAAYAATQWRDIARSLQGRGVRYGSLTVGSIVIFLALLVGLNYITNRQHKRWDLTASKQFSLSDQTKNLLKDLKKPVAVTVYYDADPSAGNQKQDLQDALSNYTYQSSQFTVSYIDAVHDPARAKQDGVDTLPTTIFAYDGRTARTTGRGESDFTNTLKKVLEGTAKKVYFIQGHGEHDLDSTDPHTGYSEAVSALKTDNFETAKLPLAQEGTIPADATLLVVAGPETDYLPGEIDAIRHYLKGGGKLLLMLDPPEKVDSPPLTNLIALAKEWGVDVGTDYVLDQSGMGQMFGAGPQVPIAITYPSHPITKDFGNVMTAFSLARSVTPINGGNNGHTAQPIAETSRASWAETDIKGLLLQHTAKPEPDKGDKLGPITIVAAASAPAESAQAPTPDAPKPETRVVVAGDSDFAGNGAIGFQGNRDLFLNIANWLAEQQDLIAIHPKDTANTPIQLNADQGTRIFWLTLVIIPALLFLNGVRVWWRRR